MGFERAVLFGLVDLELDATAGGQLLLSTDLPGNAMAVREAKPIPATGRRVVRFRLQGTTKGRLYSVKVVPNGSGVVRLYAGRIWARELPGTEWKWYAIPIPETSEEWTPMKLPIPETGEWAPAELPIPKTGEWTAAKLPIPPVSEWAPQPLPIKPTAANPEWVNIEVDQ